MGIRRWWCSEPIVSLRVGQAAPSLGALSDLQFIDCNGERLCYAYKAEEESDLNVGTRLGSFRTSLAVMVALTTSSCVPTITSVPVSTVVEGIVTSTITQFQTIPASTITAVETSCAQTPIPSNEPCQSEVFFTTTIVEPPRLTSSVVTAVQTVQIPTTINEPTTIFPSTCSCTPTVTNVGVPVTVDVITTQLITSTKTIPGSTVTQVGTSCAQTPIPTNSGCQSEVIFTSTIVTPPKVTTTVVTAVQTTDSILTLIEPTTVFPSTCQTTALAAQTPTDP